MKPLPQFAAAICSLLILGSSAALAQSIASSYSWTSTGPIISAKSDSTHNIIAVKDPSAVYYNGQWIIYASDVTSAGNYNMEYLNIGSSWSNASAATPYFMDNTPGFSGYHTAPQVFYFAPQKKWYLIFQSGQPQYSTNSDPTKPQNWTQPQNFYASQPSSVSNWIDFWVICDSQNCYLFFAGDNGNFYRASTPIGNFPNGFNTPVIVDSSSQFNMFEADNVYSVEGTGEYLADIECIGSNGQRYFRALWASSLGGTWQSLGNTDNYGTPFLGMDNVTFNSGVGNWTESFSSGGLLIDGNDQTDSVNPNNLQFLYQGVNPANSGGNYNTIPWQLGLATSKANTTGSPSFTLAPSSGTLSVAQGATATDTVTVTPVNGFSGSVTLAASGLPSGVTATFGTNPATGSSVVTFTAASTAAAGTSTVTINGTSGSTAASATIALTVTAPTLPVYPITNNTLYTVEDEASGFCINDTGGATGNGTAVEQEPCSDGDLSQEWLFTSVGTNSWEITTDNLKGAAWNVIGPSTAPGTGIQLYTYYSGALNMQFEAFELASGYAELVDENSGLCLNLPNINAGQQMQINTCNGSTSESFTLKPVSAASGSFTLSSSPAALSVTQGSTATDTVTVTPANGFSGSVTLAASGLPSGVTATFGANPATGSSVLTLTATGTATAGTSTVTITGTSGSTAESTTIALTVNAKTTSGFTLSASPSSLSIAQGASGSDTVAVTATGGFTGSVSFAATGLPSGVTAAFSPGSSTTSSVLTLTASSTAAAGAYTVTITGTSGSTTASTTIALSVSSSGGGSACTVDYTITNQWQGGFGAAVTIKNGGTATLSNWTLSWSFANGQTISGSWNGAVSQSGANVTVSEQAGQSWQNIPAGGSYSGFGFNGTSSGTNAIPTAFSLNGTACTVN